MSELKYLKNYSKIVREVRSSGTPGFKIVDVVFNEEGHDSSRTHVLKEDIIPLTLQHVNKMILRNERRIARAEAGVSRLKELRKLL